MAASRPVRVMSSGGRPGPLATFTVVFSNARGWRQSSPAAQSSSSRKATVSERAAASRRFSWRWVAFIKTHRQMPDLRIPRARNSWNAAAMAGVRDQSGHHDLRAVEQVRGGQRLKVFTRQARPTVGITIETSKVGSIGITSPGSFACGCINGSLVPAFRGRVICLAGHISAAPRRFCNQRHQVGENRRRACQCGSRSMHAQASDFPLGVTGAARI